MNARPHDLGAICISIISITISKKNKLNYFKSVEIFLFCKHYKVEILTKQRKSTNTLRALTPAWSKDQRENWHFPFAQPQSPSPGRIEADPFSPRAVKNKQKPNNNNNNKRSANRFDEKRSGSLCAPLSLWVGAETSKSFDFTTQKHWILAFWSLVSVNKHCVMDRKHKFQGQQLRGFYFCQTKHQNIKFFVNRKPKINNLHSWKRIS
jgi:hypothetical protein